MDGHMKMKKSRRKSIIALGMAVCMTAVNFSGCQNNTVDYSIDDTRTEEAAQPEGTSGLSQFADAEKWMEELAVTRADGGKVTVSIKAAIALPDADWMSVTEVRYPEFDAAYQEKLIRSIFGETEVYFYAEAISDAQGDYVKATGYESGDYMAYLDEIPFRLSFSGELQPLWILFEPVDNTLICPEALKDAAMLNLEEGSAFGLKTGFVNECQWSEEEAQELAEKFLAQAGFIDWIFLESSDVLFWDAYMKEVSLDVYTDRVTVENGYAFYYQMKSDAGCLTDTGIVVYVNDFGVFFMDVVNPYDIISETTDVPLLPLNNIEEIMRNELEENADVYFWKTEDHSYTYYRMELGYSRVPDDSKEGYYSFVPVWELAGYDGYGDVLVNAIDGGIVSEYY